MDNNLWSQARASLETKLDSNQYRKWIAALEMTGEQNDEIHLSAPNAFVRDWVYENYLGMIRDEVGRLAQRPMEVSIAVVPGAPTREEENQPSGSETPASETSGGGKTAFLANAAGSRMGLRPNYTFKEFVVGSSNQFAHAACIAVSDAPGGKYNPLFIFGGVGLGKTHLLHAIGHRILDESPDQRVIYLSSETFVNELINAIRFERMMEFREKFRTSCDVLLVDDIQFLSGKERTQEEFFHTFNTLYEAGKQIVLTSDTFPKELKSLEERLRSRFEWGLIADIQAPEMETRVAIVKQKAEANGLQLPNEVAHYLATLMKSNVRELEGSLIRLGAFASLNSQPISLELAREVLKNLQLDKNRFLSIDQVQEVVSRYFNINTVELKSSRKNKNLAYPRQIAMFLCRKVLKCSFPDIGSKFGGKDHSTVIHAVRKIEKNIKHDEQLRADVEQLEKNLSP